MFGLHRSLFTEEHDLYRQSVRDFIAKEIIPNNAAWEIQKMVSRDSWLKLGENGFLGIQAPEELGGLNVQDFRYNAIFIEELGLSGCSGPAIGYPLHNDIVLPYLLHYATAAAKQKYVPKMVSGDWIGAVAMTEPIIQARVTARLTEIPSEIAVFGSSATAVNVSPARVRLKNQDMPIVVTSVIKAPMTREEGKIMSPTMKGAGGSRTGNERSAAPHTTMTMPRIRITSPIVTITIEKTDSPTKRSKNRRSISQP